MPDGKPPLFGRYQLGVVIEDSRGYHNDRIACRNVGCVMADAHLDAHIDELSRVAALPDVRPAHPHALIGSHTGYAAHADSSDADEMYLLDAPRVHPLPFDPIRSIPRTAIVPYRRRARDARSPKRRLRRLRPP